MEEARGKKSDGTSPMEEGRRKKAQGFGRNKALMFKALMFPKAEGTYVE